MTDTKNNQEEDEIQQSRVWMSRAMNGKWDGTGRWNEDKTWSGHGTWQGGLLSGTWNVQGKWEPAGNATGNLKGHGDLISNMSFRKHTTLMFVMNALVAVATIGLVIAVATGLISSWLVIGGGIVAMLLLFLVNIVIGGIETAKGKMWFEGTWKDVGDFRILDFSGKWKLGYHTGVLSGKMKDPKP